MLHEKEDRFRQGLTVVFVECSKCAGTLGAFTFSALFSELLWRRWAVVREDGKYAIYCAKCADRYEPDHVWRGTAIMVCDRQVRDLVKEDHSGSDRPYEE